MALEIADQTDAVLCAALALRAAEDAWIYETLVSLGTPPRLAWQIVEAEENHDTEN